MRARGDEVLLEPASEPKIGGLVVAGSYCGQSERRRRNTHTADSHATKVYNGSSKAAIAGSGGGRLQVVSDWGWRSMAGWCL